MARRIATILTSLVVLALAIVSTTFVLLALTSKSWSRQNYYSGDPISYNKVWCHAVRSPFYRCGEPINLGTNDPSQCSVPNCQWYRPYGFAQTSCQTIVENVNATRTTAEECQAVHYTGSLQIAASFFIILGLLLTLVMTTLSVAFGSITGSSKTTPTEQESSSGADDAKGARRRHKATSKGPSFLSPSTPWVTLLLLFCLYAGVLLQILAQYFAIQGLVTKATPTQADITGLGEELVAATWVIDKALSTYATIAWTSALLTAGLAGVVFRTPKFQKFI